jgi:hypothetical protein
MTDQDEFRPNYYKLPNGIECKDVVGHMPYNIGTAIAYLWRAGNKPNQATSTDLQKAVHHIQFEIDRLASRPLTALNKTEIKIGEQYKYICPEDLTSPAIVTIWAICEKTKFCLISYKVMASSYGSYMEHIVKKWVHPSTLSPLNPCESNSNEQK